MTNPVRCVVDASVGIKQFIPDPLSSKVVQLFTHLEILQTEIFVPYRSILVGTRQCRVPTVFHNSGNCCIIWKYVRAGLYAAADVPKDLANLRALSLRVVSTAELILDAMNIALNYGISADDGSYVALSQQVSAPLLTLDQKLVRSVAGTSYDVRSFNDFDVPTPH